VRSSARKKRGGVFCAILIASSAAVRENDPPVGTFFGIGASADTRPALDVTNLPPIESITAESDIRAFLAPGVPAELARAALRRAWAADPRIRDFVGLAENAWDFNAAGAMPGFGPLQMTPDLRRHIAQLLGQEVAAEDTDASASLPAEAQKECAVIEKPVTSDAFDADASPQPPVLDPEPVMSEAPSSHQAPQSDAIVERPEEHEAERRSRIGSSTKRVHGRALPKW
jgi:hypothetical protein